MKKLGLPAAIAIGFIALGLMSIAMAWYRAAGKDSIQEQFPYVISGGVAGLAFIGIGVGLVLFEAGRRLSNNLNQQFQTLAESMGGTAPAKAEVPAAEVEHALETAAANGRVVVGRSSFHRPDCRLVSTTGNATFSSTEEALARGLQPCRVCEPTAAPVEAKRASAKR